MTDSFNMTGMKKNAGDYIGKFEKKKPNLGGINGGNIHIF